MVDDISTDDFLAHHGIKGMNWGVRNGPPYPLSSQSDGYSGRDYKKAITVANNLNADRKYYHMYTETGVLNGKRYNVDAVSEDYAKEKLNRGGDHGYDTQTKRIASAINEKAKQKEENITKDVRTAIEDAGGYTHGLDHRLKTVDSITRKIDTKGIEHINDALRYTSVSSNDNFVRNYNTTKHELNSKGYEEVRCKNYFDMYDKGLVKHKSVQSQFKDPNGYTFEIQFQTEQSQAAKDEKTPLYEEARSKNVTEARKNELEQQMVKLAEEVPTPKDIQTIKSH